MSNGGVASLSSAQLADRLEKSEAGRKKLRQAISILQEKLAASENLLKTNETLQQVCEQERLRADNEKKKGAEEKRLRTILEKDSAAVKDQLAKVFQRLGTVENKQKADKKELERLRNEVKLSVEGMRVAAQAVDAVQSSFQSLERNLLEKVDAAFTEAHAANQAVQQLQNVYQNIENTMNKKGSPSGNNQLVPCGTKAVSEKLVDEISRLFYREKQSHCKIEQRLSKLKSALKVGRWDSSLMIAENSDPGCLAYSHMEGGRRPSKKRKLQGEAAQLLNHKFRKRKKSDNEDVVNSAVNRLDVGLPKEAIDGQSMSTRFPVDYQLTSEEPGFAPHLPNCASNEYTGAVTANLTGSSHGNLQMPPQKQIQDMCINEYDKLSRGLDVSKEKKSTENRCFSELKGMPDLTQHKNADHQETNEPSSMAEVSITEAADLDLQCDVCSDSDYEWWCRDLVLLSPSLPDVPSPVSSVEVPLSRSDSGANIEVTWNTPHVVTEQINKANTEAAGMQHDRMCTDVCDEQINVSLQKGFSVCCSSVQPSSVVMGKDHPDRVEISMERQCDGDHTKVGVKCIQCDEVQSVELHQVAGGSVCEIATGARESLAKETGSSSHACCPSLNLSPTKDGPENFIVAFDQEQEKDFPLFVDKFGFEGVDSATISEMKDFLDILPPIPAVTFTQECSPRSGVPRGLCELGVPSKCLDPCKGPYSDDCTLNESQDSCNIMISRLKNTKDSNVSDCGLDKSSHAIGIEHVRDLPQSQSPQFQPKEPLTERLNNPDPQAVPISIHNPSSSSVAVFLVQAFDQHVADAELNTIAACIMAIHLKGYLQARKADTAATELHEATLSRVCASVSVEYLACSFISAAVDVVRSQTGGAHFSSDAKSLLVLVQVLIAFIRSMLKEQASVILNTIFTQLSRFLNQGEVMRITLHGLVGFCEDDALSFARVLQDKKHCSYQCTEATVEDIYAGGKMISWAMLFVRSF